MDVKWYLIIDSFCISLVTNDVRHLFHMLVGYLYVFGEMFKSLTHFQ